MSVDPDNRAREAGPGAPFRQELLEMLAKGKGGGATLLKELLSTAQLSSEQQSVVELLLSLDEGRPEPDASPSEGPPSPELMQELADLREVNDTMAAAVGACRACWGGDAQCVVCAGHGVAGFIAPDPGLFRELVVPAVRHVRSLGRGGGPTDACRAGRDSSRHWR